MTLETSLNLAWLLFGLLTWEFSRRRTQDQSAKHRLAVLFVIVSLFPCVSASDDLASYGLLSRQLQVLEYAQVAVVFMLLLAWCFLVLFVIHRSFSHSESRPLPADRSPPHIFSSSDF